MKPVIVRTALPLLALALCLSGVRPSQAQPNGETDAAHALEEKRAREAPPALRWVRKEPNRHEFSLWGGHAFDSFRALGKTRDATLSLMGGRYNRRLLTYGPHLLEYTAEASLYAYYTYPDSRPGREHRTDSVSGLGLSPLGFQVNFWNRRRVQPFVKSSAGLMFLARPFPDRRGTRTNFTFGVGGGLEITLSPNSSLSLGYTFFHLSNGETGQVNPGVDSGLFYGAVTLY